MQAKIVELKQAEREEESRFNQLRGEEMNLHSSLQDQ